jgi:hypothetical protein
MNNKNVPNLGALWHQDLRGQMFFTNGPSAEPLSSTAFSRVAPARQKLESSGPDWSLWGQCIMKKRDKSENDTQTASAN